MIDKKKLGKLVKKYLEGKTTEEEEKYLNFYYNNLHSGESIESLMNEAEISELEAKMFDHIQSGITRAPIKNIDRGRSHLKYVVAAASVLVVALGGFLWKYLTDQSAKTQQRFETVYAESGVKKLILSDETVVWLNTKSSLRYPLSFEPGKPRDIYLEGEAYFEVKKDPLHPLLVHSQELTTHVLGTKFNVNAYHPANVEVTLIEGKVMLTAPVSLARQGTRKTDTVFLAPNEKAIFSFSGSLEKETATAVAVDKRSQNIGITKSSVAVLQKQSAPHALTSVAWHNGQLIFENEPLGIVLESINRKLDISVKAAPELNDYPITIKIDKDPVEDILIKITSQIRRKDTNGLRLHYSAQFRKSGNDYYIE
ncbi:MAG: FecR family protein [Chitinophagaceae bacterium]|nr:FecR family protein [Chitinophagaceae bacterium]